MDSYALVQAPNLSQLSISFNIYHQISIRRVRTLSRRSLRNRRKTTLFLPIRRSQFQIKDKVRIRHLPLLPTISLISKLSKIRLFFERMVRLLQQCLISHIPNSNGPKLTCLLTFTVQEMQLEFSIDRYIHSFTINLYKLVTSVLKHSAYNHFAKGHMKEDQRNLRWNIANDFIANAALKISDSHDTLKITLTNLR